MHDRRSEIRGRLRRIVDQHLRAAERRHVADLTVAAWPVPPAPDGTVGEPVPFAEAVGQDYRPFAIGDPWGPAWATTWFRLTGAVPADLEHPELVVDLGFLGPSPGFQAEGLVHRPDGTHVKGLNPLNDWVPVGPGESVELYVEAAANPHVLTSWRPTFLGDKLTAAARPGLPAGHGRRRRGRPGGAVPAGRHRGARPARRRARRGRRAARSRSCSPSSAALDALDPTDVPATAADARGALAAVLARPAYDGAHRISAVGHAHIDSAWLWPVRETVRKVTRTVANVVNLLDDGSRSRLRDVARRSSGSGSGPSTPRCSRASRSTSRRGGSCRSAGCGWSRTPTWSAARRWRGSSWSGSGGSRSTSARRATRCGCRTRSATPPRCRRSSGRRAAGGS